MAMRSSVGSVGNRFPRSIFDSSAGDRPVCSPICTSPSFLFARSVRIFGPILYRLKPSSSVSDSISFSPASNRQQQIYYSENRHSYQDKFIVREYVFSYFKAREASGRTAASIERARCGLLRNLARRSSDEITCCQIGGSHPVRGVTGGRQYLRGHR